MPASPTLREFTSLNPEIAALREQLDAEGLSGNGDIEAALNELSAALQGSSNDDEINVDERVRRARALFDRVRKQHADAGVSALDPRAALTLPLEAITQREIREAVSVAQEAARAVELARRDLARLERERPEAEQADAEAFADALASGGKDPGAKHVDKLAKATTDARRRLTATQVAGKRALADVNGALLRHGEQWREQIADRLANQRRQWAETIDTASVLGGDIARLIALQEFVAGRAVTAHPSGLGVRLPASGEDRQPIDSLLAALRQLGES